MKFSVCIPNFNYAQFLGTTLRSVLEQSFTDFEVLVSDNHSTDSSVDVARSFDDPRIRLRVNERNVGFAGNLDCVASMATGERLIMLSSDDLMAGDALATYDRLLQALPDAGRSIVSSGQYFIDSKGVVTGTFGSLGAPILLPEDRAASLDALVGAPVYRVAARELLRRCLLSMQNPFYFATTSYPRKLYDAVGGYTARRMINPDKWFHWRLLEVADAAYYIDRPLFSYRWHASNQDSQQKRSGALKYLVDEYLSTIEISDESLSKLGLSRTDIERAFVEYDIARHGLAVLARANAGEARRILNFGKAAYPQQLRRNRKALALRLALPFGSLAGRVAGLLYQTYTHRRPRNLQAATPAAGNVKGSPS